MRCCRALSAVCPKVQKSDCAWLAIGIGTGFRHQYSGGLCAKNFDDGRTGNYKCLAADLTHGIVNFAFTFIAVWLIDKLGRKTFYIIGSSGMAITLLLIAAAFHFEMNPIFTTICIMLFIAFFASCIGPAFWTMVAEMFPNRIRGQAVALASFTQWVFNFLVVLFFPYVLDALGGSMTFLFLSVMAVFNS